MKQWNTVSPSRFAWEQEALDFIRQGLPDNESYHAWSNFEFIADDGTINEVDLLLLSPWGVFLVEIKSRPGAISGDTYRWTWTEGDRRNSTDNPTLLAERKAKKLASLLKRQAAFKDTPAPYVESLVFCSHPTNFLKLEDVFRARVCVRDDAGPGSGPGIRAALLKRACPGLKAFDHPPVNAPVRRAFLRAFEKLGIRRGEGNSRIGDYRLDVLLYESPAGAWQDWRAAHTTAPQDPRFLLRLYLSARVCSKEERETLQRAAQREFNILGRLDHPNILKVDTLTSSEAGEAIVFRLPLSAVRLDHYLAERGEALSMDERLSLLRQITEAIRYAHSKGAVHRLLSPQSVLVIPTDDDIRVKVYNWQVGSLRAGSRLSSHSRVSATVHAEQLFGDLSPVFLAPEFVSGHGTEGPELDIFSLGAIAYLLFTGKAPASSVTELETKLQQGGGHLNPADVMPGVPGAIEELVKLSAASERAMRYTADEFLKQLVAVEDELTRPPEIECVDPRKAGPEASLEHGLEVVRRLGSGSISVVLLVKDSADRERVLKVAATPEHNTRIRAEYELLKKIRHPHVVEAFDELRFGDVFGFTMDPAGEMTLAQRLQKDGRLDLDLLQRFGDELIRLVNDLDRAGFAHRDIKPDNIGIRNPDKGHLRIALFDFSLANSPPENIRVGTPPYLDPFLALRKVPRWDAHAERFAVAVTLYQMASGALPHWGDSENAPHLVSDEVTLHPDLFAPAIRDRLAKFFAKALRREFRERFDNCDQMRVAWEEVFRDIDRPAVPTAHGTAPTSHQDLVAQATPQTQLVLLGLSTRLLNSVDSLGLVTVADLLKYPIAKIHQLRGVGNKTRQELANLVRTLRARFPDLEPKAEEEVRAASAASPGEGELASVDRLAKELVLSVGSRAESRERAIIQAFLGWEDARRHPADWPSQADLAPKMNVTRAYVGIVVAKARDRWGRIPQLTLLRDSIFQLLRSRAGVMPVGELIRSVLATRGSLLDEPLRSQMASLVARAAVETEGAVECPRFSDYRRDGRVFVALTPDLANYAMRLGKEADRLVAQEPLPSPAQIIQALRLVSCPDLAEDVVAPDNAALVHLASASSENACANARLELYPRGMEARRALALSLSALFGRDEFTVDAIQRRIAERYPEAEGLPGRPSLDDLLKDAGAQLVWDPKGNDGAGAYRPRVGGLASLTPSTLTRIATRSRTRVPSDDNPEIVAARKLDERLRRAEAEGAYLVLSAPPDRLQRAEAALLDRFKLEPLDADAVFIDAMRGYAETRKADWARVLAADAAPQTSADWSRLQIVVEGAFPAVREAILAPGRSRLLLNPGLLVRYDRTSLLDEARDLILRQQGPKGLWLLIPGSAPDTLPSLNGHAIPVLSTAQHAWIPDAWLRREHEPLAHT